MEFPQDLTDEIVTIWDIAEVNLVYNYPFLMNAASEYPTDNHFSIENFGEQLDDFSLQDFVLQPSSDLYFAPISEENPVSFLQNQNDDITIQFTNHKEETPPQNTKSKNSSTFFGRISDNTKNNNVNQDSDEDVIFVKEYKSIPTRTNRSAVSTHSTEPSCSKQKDSSVRRNPTRQARKIKPSSNLKGHLVEGDLAFLDESEDENLILSANKENPSSSAISTSATSISSKENFKLWPPNVYERPEYNPETEQVEPFDYTIREIQKNYVKKRPRLELVPKPSSKPKKRYFIRKRRPKGFKPIEKVSFNDIEDTIRETYDTIKEFCNKQQDDRAEKFEFLLKNQSVLVEILNDFKNISLQKK